MTRKPDGVLERASAYRRSLRAALAEQFPHLCTTPPAVDPSAVVLGRDQDGKPLFWSLRARLEHSLVIGTTGAGKTRLIEHVARQDIEDGRAVVVVDPHGSHPGSLFRSLLGWLHSRGYTRTRTIHVIDPNAGTHVTGMNPLARPSDEYESTVIAEAMQEAIERVWGEENMDTKPTMQRTLSAILTALTELQMTLAEARLLFDPEDRDGIREWVIANLHNDAAREELEYLHSIAAEPRGRQDFRQELVGPRNRLAKLTRDDAIKAMVGQQRTIDFRAALDEGHIILANLSPGPRAGDKAMQLVGRLLTRLVFFNAVRRVHPERQAFLFADECQLYLSGDVSRMLAEARKFGLGCVLSSQSLASFKIAGDEIVDAIKNMTNTKIALRIKNPEEAEELAEMLFQYDLELPVKALVKPTVVGHRVIRLRGAGTSERYAATESQSNTEGESVTRGETYTIGETYTRGRAHTKGTSGGRGGSTTQSSATSRSSAENVSNGESNSQTYSRSQSDGRSTNESSGTGRGETVTQQYVPSTWDPEEESDPEEEVRTGIVRGQSVSATSARSNGLHSSTGESWGRGTSLNSSRGSSRSESVSAGVANSDSWTDSVSSSETTSSSESRSLSRAHSLSRGMNRSHTEGLAETRGHATTESWHEALEPIYEDRPTAVHGIENVRYMASAALRRLRSGYAAVSFVDHNGLKTAALTVANVESYALPDRLFNQLRTFVFNRSPSAMQYDQAIANIADRQQALLDLIQRTKPREPETPTGYRTKKTRTSSAKRSVDLHDEQTAPQRDPVKGPDRLRRRSPTALDRPRQAPMPIIHANDDPDDE